MPKVPIDYSRTQIYKWVCNDSSVLCEYIGHTTNWNKRKASHKERCNQIDGKKYHLKLYEIMRANKGFDNWKMILIEDYPCKSKREAEQREQYHMDLLVEKINTIRAFQTKEQRKEEMKEKRKEYVAENINKIKEQRKEYRQQNKEKTTEYKREKIVCECGVTCSRDFMYKHKRTQKHLTYLEGLG